MAVLSVTSSINPADLAINIRFKEKQIIHPRVRAAQDGLITDIKLAVPDSYETCNPCTAEVTFVFTSNRFDIDGPIKRTLDAIQKALKAKGYIWSDSRIHQLTIYKEVDELPCIELEMW